MILIELFLTFVRIGFTSFGGISTIPLILEEMERHQWMNASDLSNLIAIAEMTPGTFRPQLRHICGDTDSGLLGQLGGGGWCADTGVYADAGSCCVLS